MNRVDKFIGRCEGLFTSGPVEQRGLAGKSLKGAAIAGGVSLICSTILHYIQPHTQPDEIQVQLLKFSQVICGILSGTLGVKSFLHWHSSKVWEGMELFLETQQGEELVRIFEQIIQELEKAEEGCMAFEKADGFLGWRQVQVEAGSTFLRDASTIRAEGNRIRDRVSGIASALDSGDVHVGDFLSEARQLLEEAREYARVITTLLLEFEKTVRNSGMKPL